jgi:asparagine synthase (glutamine-hydrolysing)
MCGICGTTGIADERLMRRMCEVLVHRGPDDIGFYIDKESRISLGVRRLSIIDLKGGHQPIHNEDKKIWIVFNGEIYNFVELREFLKKKGHSFYTRTDTETIVHLYEEYGEACVNALQGMFAFALWDEKEEKLFVARDRLGIKPLYYYERKGKLVIGSEIKAILEHPDVSREVNLEALDLYLTLQYVPSPLTMFSGIKKLPPGHCLVWKRGKMKIKQYWDVAFLERKQRVDEEAAKEELKSKIEEAVRVRMRADVPVGVLLSGGIDSGAITGFATKLSHQPVKTFTVGFEASGDYNELKEARLISKRLNTDHHEIILNAPKTQELLPKLIWHLDEPLADQAAIPTYLVSRFARSKVKVVLTGEGGDEFFGGYPRYSWFKIAKMMQDKIPPGFRKFLLQVIAKSSVGEEKKRYAQLLLGEFSDAERHISWIGSFSNGNKEILYGERMKENLHSGVIEDLVSGYLEDGFEENLLHSLMYLDVKTWLVDDILTKVDKMSMATSLEARVPFLDHRLVEFVATLPASFKVRGLKTKFLLKRTLDGILPAEILNKRKHAFLVPTAEWFQNGMREFVREVLFSETTMNRGYFNSEYVKWLVNEHFAGRRDSNQEIWSLLCFELWHRLFIDKVKM